MQKKKILIYSLIMISILSVFLLSNYIGKKTSSLDEVRLKDTVINKNNNLAIMLETEADSGKYEEADSIVFPKSQYKFNAELSGCLDMNGLKIDNVLTYKDGMAYVEVGTSAYCYLYFNLPPKFVNYLLNEKNRPTSLWTSTLDGDGYRFVGGESDNCSYFDADGLVEVEKELNVDGTCPTMYVGASCDYMESDEDRCSGGYVESCSVTDCDHDYCTCDLLTSVKPEPTNYICFGTTDKDTCLSNTDLYMYRIIGIFKDSEGNNHLKLIKNVKLNTSYMWHNSNEDVRWEDSDLYAGLHGSYFLNNTTYSYMQNADWSDMITDWTWSSIKQLSSGLSYASETAGNVFYHEMNHANKSNTVGEWTTPMAQFGLMYASDYLLSLGEVNYNAAADYYKLEKGWLASAYQLSSKAHEWTMVRAGRDSYYSWFYALQIQGVVQSAFGKLQSNDVNSYAAVRPVFYLNTDVLYDNGSGTATDPFIIYTEAEESVLPTYTITGSSNNTSAGTVTVDTPTVEYGGTAQWTISVKSGYYYSSNSCGATKSGNTLTLTNVTSDTSCTVYFYQQSTTTYYAVYVTSNDTTYGTVSPTGVSVIAGGSTSITLNPAAGYEYKSNTCGGTVSGNKMTIRNITSDKTCTVTFGRPDVTITVSSNNTSYGTVSPGSQTVPQGEAAIFTLSPATGYKYSSNTCGGTVSGNTMTVQQVVSTTSCTVTFTQLSYRVTLTVVDNLGNTVDRQLTMVQHGGTATFDVSTYIAASYLTGSVSCNNLIVDGGVSGNTLYINHVTETLNCSMRVSKAV